MYVNLFIIHFMMEFSDNGTLKQKHGGIPYLLLQTNLLKTETPSKVYLTVYKMLSYLVLKSQNEKKKKSLHIAAT